MAIKDPYELQEEWEESRRGMRCEDCARCVHPYDVIDGRWGKWAADTVLQLTRPWECVERSAESIATEIAYIVKHAQEDVCWCEAYGQFVKGSEPADECDEWRVVA